MKEKNLDILTKRVVRNNFKSRDLGIRNKSELFWLATEVAAFLSEIKEAETKYPTEETSIKVRTA